MRSSIEFLPKSNFIRLIVMIIAALLLVGLVLALSTPLASASPETSVPNSTMMAADTTLTRPAPLYDDPSYFELQLRRVKQRLLRFLTIILEELPLRQSLFRLPNNTLFWRIIPL